MEDKKIGSLIDELVSLFESNMEELRVRMNKLEKENAKLKEMLSKLGVVSDEPLKSSKQDHLRSDTVAFEMDEMNKLPESCNGCDEMIYVTPSQRGEEIYLICNDDHKEYSIFVLNSLGNTAEVNFNKDCVLNLLNDIEVNLLPFTDCGIEASGVPTLIRQVEPGLAKFDNNNWKLEKKVKLIIN